MGASLDFSTNPPTVSSNSTNAVGGAGATISNAAGNLLFHTNSVNVWNKNHIIMANGTGLTGNTQSTQNSIIVKKPGNNTIYYVFTTGGLGGLAYSTVDMSLSLGTGSVTVKNTTLVASFLSMKLSAVRHCNNTDIWVVARDSYYLSPGSASFVPMNFTSFLVTAAGVVTTAVVSPAHTYNVPNIQNLYQNYDYGCMKISPNGKKIGLVNTTLVSSLSASNVSVFRYELYDFNTTTGAITNSLGLVPNLGGTILYVNNFSFGCEFSPDGSKFYGSNQSPHFSALNNPDPGILQWNLCAGSNSAIATSQYTVANSFTNAPSADQYATMQLGLDGKIYIAKCGKTALAVINNPNLGGAACNFSPNGLSLAPLGVHCGLPNFMSSYFKQSLATPFTFTVNPASSCLTATFTAPPNLTINCAAAGYSFTSYAWIFGDPGSGSSNTSTLTNPTHDYPSPGTYTASLVYYYACGTDTVKLPVSVVGASLTINTASITCASLGSATVTATGGIGPYSYTWTPTAQTTSVAIGLNPGAYSIKVFDNGGNCAFTSTTVFTSLVPFTGLVANSTSIICNGVKTGTANIPVAGGSGGNIYNWTDGISTYTVANPANLGAGGHTITVIDALTSCSLTQFFVITQPPALTLTIVANTPTACAGSSISLSASNSGGLPGGGAGYTYTWTNSAAANTLTTTQTVAGNYNYTINSSDGSNCIATQTISLGFIVNPVVSVPVASICPLNTGVLTASGASTYTWGTSGFFGNTFSDNPTVTTVYTVTGSALGCTSAARTATIFLKSIPSPTLSSNSPLCNGKSLDFSAVGGSLYLWSGPLGFSSTNQNPSINPASPNRSGVYNLTITAVNSCTAQASINLTVHPSPTVSVAGSTVCVTQTLNLTSGSVPGATFFWSGPNSYSSMAQNPSIPSPSVGMSGVYIVTVISAQTCSNLASTNAQVVALPIPTIVSNYSAMCSGVALALSGGGGNSYAWSGPNGFNSNLQNTNVGSTSLASAGFYSLVVTTGPCVVSAGKSITIYPLPNPSASNVPVCETKSLQINANGGGGIVFFWSGPQSYTSNVQNPVFPFTTMANTGWYSLQVTDTNNCRSTITTYVNVMANPIVSTTGANVCFGQQAVLTASGAATYTWGGPAGFFSNIRNAIIQVANSASPQQFTVTGSAANSCTAIGVAMLVTIALPVPSLTMLPRVCLNAAVYLEGSGGSSYEWTGPYNFYSKKQSLSFIASNLGYNGSYQLTVSNNAGCKNSVSSNLIIDAIPEGDLIGKNLNRCVPFCSDFKFKQKEGSAVVNALWQMNNRRFIDTIFNYCTTEAENNVVIGSFTNAAGCTNTTSFVIEAYESPKADFFYTPELPVENIDEVVFVDGAKGQQINSWNWYFADNKDYKSTVANPSFLFERAGTYFLNLVVKNKWGCSDTVTKTVVVENDFMIFVPNSFTPNEDAINDIFSASGNGIVKYDLEIYNRWGEKVFQSNDLNKGWDGKFKGQDCQSEVYVWKIIAVNAKGKTKSLNGFVTLYR